MTIFGLQILHLVKVFGQENFQAFFDSL